MRVRYSFSCKKTGYIDKMRKQREKYPNVMQKVISESDIILEVVDARFTSETRDKELEKFITDSGKKLICVLNKSDLLTTKRLKEQLRGLKSFVVVSCKNRTGIKKLRDLIKKEANMIKKTDEKFDKAMVGVIGYPNSGKSSLINLLIGRASAGVGSEAGFTKGLQKLKLSANILLLDSPGVIPVREYSDSQKDALARHTKVGGRSYTQVKDPEIVVDNLMKEFKGVLEKFYKINAEGNSEILIEELGKRKGYLLRGKEVNEDKTARLILKDWQEGRIKI